MAERVGFEPTVEFPLHTLSKRAPSTTRTSLRLSGINSLPRSTDPAQTDCDVPCDGTRAEKACPELDSANRQSGPDWGVSNETKPPSLSNVKPGDVLVSHSTAVREHEISIAATNQGHGPFGPSLREPSPPELLVRRAMGGDLHDVRVVLGQPRIDAQGVCF